MCSCGPVDRGPPEACAWGAGGRQGPRERGGNERGDPLGTPWGSNSLRPLALSAGAGICPLVRPSLSAQGLGFSPLVALGTGAGIPPLVRPSLSAQELGSHPQSGNHEQSLHAATKGQHSQ